jgi:hypothetical protein
MTVFMASVSAVINAQQMRSRGRMQSHARLHDPSSSAAQHERRFNMRAWQSDDAAASHDIRFKQKIYALAKFRCRTFTPTGRRMRHSLKRALMGAKL